MCRRLLAPLAVAAAVLSGGLLLAACGSSPADVPARTAPPSSATASPASDPGAVETSSATSEPVPSASIAASSPGSGATAEPAATDTPGPSEGSPAVPPGAEGCSGSAENRDFFAAAAEAMSWDVYCAVVPDGWFVETGSYRLVDGGRLDITYRGPDGELIAIREGAWCTGDAATCAPRDRELGPAAFGDRAGVLVALGGSDADGFAIHVDPGSAPSWAITGTGMDAARLTAIAAALHRVSE
ncbi:MAG: hypothetical protein MUE82_09495 [Chloroflexi bacterium]|nr:hypothetical protein [Chloroflexota bacterium]